MIILFFTNKRLSIRLNDFHLFYFINGMLQDRLVKVVSFVSSLLDDIKKPILIIASTSALSLWEIEFSKWSKSVNVVTYKGTKDIRTAIRGSKFQVLLSSPDAIVEDVKTLNHMKWELLVIDECQRPVISMHFKKIQMLMADVKVLTVSGEPAVCFLISFISSGSIIKK
ncbi:putative DNA helicase chromatin remodeling SNF2 family [Helianthus anomalus]